MTSRCCGRVAIAPSLKAKAFTQRTRKLTNMEEKGKRLEENHLRRNILSPQGINAGCGTGIHARPFCFHPAYLPAGRKNDSKTTITTFAFLPTCRQAGQVYSFRPTCRQAGQKREYFTNIINSSKNGKKNKNASNKTTLYYFFPYLCRQDVQPLKTKPYEKDSFYAHATDHDRVFLFVLRQWLCS